MQERSSSRLTEWLDNLSRESWQLELIISGFAIFLLIGIYEPLEDATDALMKQGLSQALKVGLGLLLGIVFASWFILLINLCIHVLFRGLWISTVGLRSVSDGIDYNLIDNRFGRGVGFLLVPYIALLMVGSSLKYVSGAYFPGTPPAHTVLKTRYYDDQRAEGDFSEAPGIPSRFIRNGFLDLFIPYVPEKDDKALEALCPGLEAVKTPGITLKGTISIEESRREMDIDSILLCMGSIHQAFVDDSLFRDPGFRFYTHPDREENGLLAVLDVGHLPRGEHLLRVESRRLGADTLVWQEVGHIPFWKE